MGVRRAWWAVARRWWAVALVATVGAALCVRVPAASSTREHFPRHAPAALAHLLADFNMQPHYGSWRIESDWSNYTSWRYTVSFECGARCAGRAAVEAHERHAAAPAAPSHGRAQHHAVHVASAACTSLPLLPWITFCDEEETTAMVSSDGAGGALLEQQRATRCAAAVALAGGCARRLRRADTEQLQRLRRALP